MANRGTLETNVRSVKIIVADPVQPVTLAHNNFHEMYVYTDGAHCTGRKDISAFLNTLPKVEEPEDESRFPPARKAALKCWRSENGADLTLHDKTRTATNCLADALFGLPRSLAKRLDSLSNVMDRDEATGIALRRDAVAAALQDEGAKFVKSRCGDETPATIAAMSVDQVLTACHIDVKQVLTSGTSDKMHPSAIVLAAMILDTFKQRGASAIEMQVARQVAHYARQDELVTSSFDGD